VRALTDAVREDILGELAGLIELARDRHPGGCAQARVSEMARAFRRWALDHPAEFWLALGPEPAGGGPEPAGAAGLPAVRFPRLVAVFFDEFPRPGPASGFPPPALLGFASAWARLYGLIAIEASGRAPWPPAVADALFEAELAGLGHLPDG
jgi:AcrR family transcriptional regulator